MVNLDAITSLFAIGGWVMYPLSFLSVLALTLIAERALFWLLTHSRARDKRMRLVSEKVQQGDLSGAESSLDQDGSVYAAVLRPVIRAARRGGNQHDVEAQGLQAMEAVRGRIERFSAWLSATITAAPMLGILGTVVGIIDSFQLLGQTQAVTDPTQAAAGIAQALYTTAYGLIIAMLALFPLVLFRSQADRCFGRLEAMIAVIAAAPRTRERV
jgi:biopolymer transport protein ExbB